MENFEPTALTLWVQLHLQNILKKLQQEMARWKQQLAELPGASWKKELCLLVTTRWGQLNRTKLSLLFGETVLWEISSVLSLLAASRKLSLLESNLGQVLWVKLTKWRTPCVGLQSTGNLELVVWEDLLRNTKRWKGSYKHVVQCS